MFYTLTTSLSFYREQLLIDNSLLLSSRGGAEVYLSNGGKQEVNFHAEVEINHNTE